MLRGIYTSACGMLIESMQQDVVANNIANVDTPGFKADRIAIRTEPEWEIHRVDDRKLERIRLGIDPMPHIGDMGTGAAIADRYTVQKQGPVVPTGNPLDVALDGAGFFMVETAEGPRYTRAGNFRVNTDGILVDANGNRLSAITSNTAVNPETQVVHEGGELGITTTNVQMADNSPYQIAQDGQVFVNGDPLYRLVVVKFENAEHLVKTGDNYYTYGGPNTGTFASETRTLQGSIEHSNVRSVEEMVKMIVLMRSYEANSKIIQAHDDELNRAVNNIGRLG